MDEVTVNSADIDALAETVDDRSLPARDLLRALLGAIRTVAGGEQPSVELTVLVQGLPETFDAALTAKEAAGASVSGQGAVKMTVAKITRSTM